MREPLQRYLPGYTQVARNASVSETLLNEWMEFLQENPRLAARMLAVYTQDFVREICGPGESYSMTMPWEQSYSYADTHT